MQPVLAAAGRRVCIDHHAEGDFPAHAEVIDPTASSTGELVYELGCRLLGLERLPLEISLPVYVAVLTDTGGFRFGNTHPHTHRLAAELLAAGVNPPEVHHQVYENVKPEAVRLLGLSLASLRVEAGGKLAWLVVTQEHLVQSGARPEDVDGFVDQARAVAGVEMVVMFLELASGRLKVSLRSREPVNVQQVASRLGGGGHKQAAGILMEGPWDTSREAVLAAARAVFDGPRADA
jgi:phosphoesterase RecJ-like protein